jgi:alcohol dehydrogenase (cytochrome c)
MRQAWLAAIAVLGSIVVPLAQSTDDLVHDGRNPDNVTTQSMGLHRRSYSPLKQITRANVRRLVPVWSTSLMNDMGELAAPTIYDGVMYVINGKWTFAIDLETGRQIWRTAVQLEPGITRAAITRGAATIYNGKIFRVTIDNHVLALDMKTGKEVWNQKFANAAKATTRRARRSLPTACSSPGMAGGESTTRGFLDGWDPRRASKLWRRYTIPAPGEPGSETWPKDSEALEDRGRADRGARLVRPELDLVYWGVGNASRTIHGLAARSTACTRRASSPSGPRPARSVCHYQYTPNDVYDVDGNDEQVLPTCA